jgi:hypothetical protein
MDVTVDGKDRLSPIKAEHFFAAAQRLDTQSIAILLTMRDGHEAFPFGHEDIKNWANQAPADPNPDGCLDCSCQLVRYVEYLQEFRAKGGNPKLFMEWRSDNSCADHPPPPRPAGQKRRQ